MAKNFVQHGKTIEIANTGSAAILSGSPVMVGKVVAIAITDIAAGQTGTVFRRCFPAAQADYRCDHHR